MANFWDIPSNIIIPAGQVIRRNASDTGFESIDLSPWTQVQGEALVWAINGINLDFTISHTPLNWARIYLNGIRQKESIDCSTSSNIITFTIAPVPWDILLADYNF